VYMRLKNSVLLINAIFTITVYNVLNVYGCLCIWELIHHLLLDVARSIIVACYVKANE
jgi:hypothetical protein